MIGFLEQSAVLNLFGLRYYSVVRGTEWFWAIGVLVTLFGATLTVVGFMVQKQSHSRVVKDSFGRPGASPRPYWMEARWLMGGLIWLAGNLVCWVALGLAPQSILAAINCWNIVITLVIAPWFLGEPVSMRTAMSALLLAFGTGWVVAFGPKHYQQHTVTLIVEAFKKPQSVVAFGITFTFLISMLVVGWKRWQSAASQTLSYFQFTAVSGVFAWYATLLSKSTAKVLVASVQLHQPLYLNPTFVALAAAFPLCAVAQVHFLNMGLKYGDAVMVIPLYEALSMTGQIVIGGLVFNEFAELGPRQQAWFWPGVVLVLLGILSLACEVREGKGSSTTERIPLLGKTKDVEQSKSY
jgi:uncharacterized membrane protein